MEEDVDNNDDEDEEIFQTMMSATDQVIHTIKALNTPVRERDEFTIFHDIFFKFKVWFFCKIKNRKQIIQDYNNFVQILVSLLHQL